MKCPNCGRQFLVKDAEFEFESHFNYDLSYVRQEHLCGNCAIDDVESQIEAGMAIVTDNDDE